MCEAPISYWAASQTMAWTLLGFDLCPAVGRLMGKEVQVVNWIELVPSARRASVLKTNYITSFTFSLKGDLCSRTQQSISSDFYHKSVRFISRLYTIARSTFQIEQRHAVRIRNVQQYSAHYDVSTNSLFTLHSTLEGAFNKIFLPIL